MSNQNSERKNRCIDIVFCIDGTASMSECIDSVKDNARKFEADFSEAMTRLNSDIDAVRVKVIVFRDYGCDGNGAMQISKFFTLPQDEDEYANYVSAIQAKGGGDGPENGFEALYYAMKSEFAAGDDDRQLIVMFTDADALDLGERNDSENYPRNMIGPEDLKKMWYGMQGLEDNAEFLNQLTKRLVIFAPAGTKYDNLGRDWKFTWFKATAMEGGMGEIDFSEVIDLMAKSASTKARK